MCTRVRDVCLCLPKQQCVHANRRNVEEVVHIIAVIFNGICVCEQAPRTERKEERLWYDNKQKGCAMYETVPSVSQIWIQFY